jgi:putative flippase GtrA
MIYSQFIKFGLVGASGLVIDFFITWLLKEKFNFNKYVSNALGFSVAVTNNYFLNSCFTFENNHPIALQFISFIGIALIGLALNLLILYLFQTYTKLNFYLSKMMAIVFVFVWNFTANYFFTFK